MTQHAKDTETAPLVFGGQNTAERPTGQAMWRGMKKKCPQCGKGRLFRSFTTIENKCENCDLDFTGHRADDAPPYFTMLISGHLVIPLALEVKRHFHPPILYQFLAWGSIMAFLIWYLLPITKGALIGLQWAKKMHGFSESPDAHETPAAP